MRRLAFIVVLFLSFTLARADDELLANKSDLAGYGAEIARIVSEPDEIVSQLRNGMIVIVRRVPSPVVAVRGYALTGGVYEGKWLGGGLSHLLEHLVAGGSNGRRTEEQNRDLLQAIGNDSNAYTSTDHTAFFVNTTPTHMEQAIDLVTGWMLTAEITEPEYRREYQVVQRELEMDKGNPDFVFGQMTNFNRYRVSQERIPVIGYQEVIQGLKVEDVRGYYHLAYQPNNMVFAVAGNLDPETMLKAVEKNVADAVPGRVFSHDVTPEPQVLAPRTLVATFPKLGSARLEIAYPSVKLDDPDLYALDLLATILGQGESSILVQRLRDEQQLVTDINTGDNTPSYVTGTFAVDAQCDAAKIPAIRAAVLAEVEKLRTSPIDPDRIARAKVQTRVQHVASLQTAESVAGQLATDFFQTGDVHFQDKYTDRIVAVTSEQLTAVARKYLDPQRLLVTALIPSEAAGTSELPKAEDLLRAPPTTNTLASATTEPAKEVATDQQITRFVLPNGTVVLHKRLAAAPVVSMKLFALGGVSDEIATNNGIGNISMKLDTRGTSKRSATQIAEFLDSIGASVSAECGNNSWHWEANCLTQNVDQMADVFADIVLHPTFPDAEIAEMKQRIDAGIDSEDADWTDQAFHYFKQQYFGPLNSPRQFLPIGTKENLASFTPDAIRTWYHDRVLTAPRVLAIFGDIDLDHAKALATRYFADAPSAAVPAHVELTVREPATAPATQPSEASENVTRIAVQKTEQPLAGVVIGFDSNSVITQADQPLLTMADCMTSGYAGPTGYLFDVLRGKGLVYVVDAEDAPGITPQKPGVFLAYAGCDPHKINDVVDLMLQNIARLQGKPADIRPDWFDRSKQLIIKRRRLGK